MAKETDQNPCPEVHGPSLRLVSTAPLALAILALIALLITALLLNTAQNDLTVSEKRYVSAQVSANELKNASDAMTTSARLFAYTGDPIYLRKYFDDNVTNSRRERAVEGLSSTMAGSSAESTLKLALDYSNTLMEREYTSMSLVLTASGSGFGRYENLLDTVPLSEEQLALSPEEQRSLALELVLDGDYQFYDNMVDTNVNNCVGFLAKDQNQTERELTARIQRLIVIQQALLILLASIIGVTACIIIFFVMLPLRTDVDQIQKLDDLPMQGAFELQYLAKAYNLVLAENRRNNLRLTYEAEHDALTGLFNRGAFDRLYLEKSQGPCAMIHVDVDFFKSINDTYGHERGDLALQKVAKALCSCFRHTDFPCRTGGDEFAIIMAGVYARQQELIRSKLERVHTLLLDTSDGLPPITLSIGVAFQDSAHATGNLYKDADAALYAVKERGRNGIAFFDGPDTAAVRWEA